MALTVQEKFDKSVKYIQSLPKDGPYQPDQNTKLTYYKYFKQATEGDVNIPRPAFLDFVGKAKWDAWDGVKGISKEDAQKLYVETLVKDLEKLEQSEEVKQLLEELKA